MLCSLIVYATIVHMEALNPLESRSQFLFQVLGLGPYNLIVMLTLAYPLRVPLAFPMTCFVGVASFACSFSSQSKLLASPVGQSHLEFLSNSFCPSGLIQELISSTFNAPCSPDNVLLFLWCAQSSTAVVVLFYIIVILEARRRKTFLGTFLGVSQARVLQDRSLFLWVDYFFLYHWLTHFLVAAFAMLALKA